MKLYTRGGDKGDTGLYKGKRVSKSSIRITAIGEVDELNAMIGLVITKKPKSTSILQTIQHQLFMLGADLATRNQKEWKMKERHVKDMEKIADRIGSKLRPQKTFILPGGTKTGAWLHYARCVSRRAERAIVKLHEKERTNPRVIKYMNRLSSLLFGLARQENAKIKEVPPDYEARL